MNTANPNTPDLIEAEERALKAVELRKAGATYDQIARVLKYSGKGAAHNAVKRVRDTRVSEASAELVALEADRLDKYLVALDTAIKAGDTKAIGAALKISERRAKLLGLDDFERRMAEVNERKVALQERDARAVAGVLANVVRKLELDPGKMQLARELITSELKALGAAPQTIKGEVE